MWAVEKNGKTGAVLFFLLYFICNLICLWEKINLWWQSAGQLWKQWSSFAMGKFLLENATNLSKMNHSHFIWTSVLTPPRHPSYFFLLSLLPTFIHLWQFYYKLCRWLEAQESNKNAAWRRSKMLRSRWVSNDVYSVLCSMSVTILMTFSTITLSTPEKTHQTKNKGKFVSVSNFCWNLLNKDIHHLRYEQSQIKGSEGLTLRKPN